MGEHQALELVVAADPVGHRIVLDCHIIGVLGMPVEAHLVPAMAAQLAVALDQGLDLPGPVLASDRPAHSAAAEPQGLKVSSTGSMGRSV